MIRIEDFDDADLIAELRGRGYAVYEGEEMQRSIAKLDGLQDHLISKLNAFKRRS